MSTAIKNLREQMAVLATNARAKLDEITEKTDETRAKEIEREFDAMMADHDKLQKRVDQELKILDMQAANDEIFERMEKSTGRPITQDAEGRQEGATAPEYKDVFIKAMRFGNARLTDSELSVLEKRAQSAGTDAEGGYTVPEGFSGEIDKALAAWGPMLDGNIVRIYPTATGNPVPWPTVDYTSTVGELKAENGAATDDGGNDIVFGQKVLNAYLYDSEVVKVSRELLQDSYFNMETLLSELFGESLSRTVNTALTTGTGSSQPNGVVTASSAGKTAASATAITADELIDLLHSVDPAYRGSPNARWMFNDSTLAAIRKLKDGQSNYLWQMGDVRTGAPATLLGHPYSVNQAMASIATTNKTVLFGDFSKYVVRRVGGTEMLALRERYAENLQVGFIAFLRVDGELLNTSAVKHLVQA